MNNKELIKVDLELFNTWVEDAQKLKKKNWILNYALHHLLKEKYSKNYIYKKYEQLISRAEKEFKERCE